MYVGNWKLFEGVKVKHGHGKITFPGVNGQKGSEEYDGDWVEDKMDGYGRYQFTSGAVYQGEWKTGKMHGEGKIVNADGTSYEGTWENNLYHGEGKFVDADQVVWEGIFVHGSYESKIQKKLRIEKEVGDKIKEYQQKAVSFFTTFADVFAKSDKKTFKDNLGPMFATPETCIDFVAEPYTKYEERAPDKWNELFKGVYDEGRVNINVLRSKEDSTVIKAESVLIDQMRSKKGGQLVEIESTVAEKNYLLSLCELPNESWVLVYCGEKVQ